MSVLVVGSIALDSMETPVTSGEDLLGGSALYFSMAASFFTDVRLVGVVGTDFPDSAVDLLRERTVDVTGLQWAAGQTFRWSGRYHSDMNQRDTLDTRLNVFENFTPVIPETYRSAEVVFLANIHPSLQLEVLRQIEHPELVVTDTMNLWIDSTPKELEAVIRQTDLFVLNDAEAKQQLTGESNLVVAARQLRAIGPEYLVIKKGEHGALLMSDESIFFAPGFPLEQITDPTGAGDVFAGGMVGVLDQAEELNDTLLRQAVVYGSTGASYNVESLSLNRLKHLTKQEIENRYEQFKALTRFTLNEEAGAGDREPAHA